MNESVDGVSRPPRETSKEAAEGGINSIDKIEIAARSLMSISLRQNYFTRKIQPLLLPQSPTIVSNAASRLIFLVFPSIHRKRSDTVLTHTPSLPRPPNGLPLSHDGAPSCLARQEAEGPGLIDLLSNSSVEEGVGDAVPAKSVASCGERVIDEEQSDELD